MFIYHGCDVVPVVAGGPVVAVSFVVHVKSLIPVVPKHSHRIMPIIITVLKAKDCSITALATIFIVEVVGVVPIWPSLHSRTN